MLINNKEYFDVLNEIKNRIKAAQYRAVLGVNCEQILLYWNIGKIIIANTKYGAKFIENLARDIKAEFPNAKGYSARRLKYMRQFAEVMNDEQKVLTVSALLSWSHNILLLNKSKTQEEFEWYSKQTIENDWSLFKPEYAGKLNFYLSAVDDILKHETDNPSIGIMLCKTKDKLTAEYALKDINKPIGVSEYKLSDFVPAELIDTLPSAEDIEKRVKMKFDIEEENE